jgi:hypothetical protein
VADRPPPSTADEVSGRRLPGWLATTTTFLGYREYHLEREATTTSAAHPHRLGIPSR